MFQLHVAEVKDLLMPRLGIDYFCDEVHVRTACCSKVVRQPLVGMEFREGSCHVPPSRTF